MSTGPLEVPLEVLARSPFCLLFTQVPATPMLDSTASPEDKLALMRALFGTRTDVFALRWENVSSGKAGWSPAVRGGWANKRARKDYLPLTDDVIARHLRGDATVGIYPLMRGDTSTLLACDFGGGTWVLDALAYLDACHRAEVPAALERSRSGDGAHVWVFFDGPVTAATARSLGTSLLREAMTARAELDLSADESAEGGADEVDAGKQDDDADGGDDGAPARL